MLPENTRIEGFSLDHLCQRFGVVPHDRHTAAGDAFITAQVFQRLLRLARKAGRDTLGALAEPFPVPDRSGSGGEAEATGPGRSEAEPH